MFSKDVIKKYFDDPEKAEDYIRHRLLEDYSKAPPAPPTAGWAAQMVHAMDVLKIIFGELPVHAKKNQFSKKQYLDVCLKCYLDWGDTTSGKDNAPANRAKGIYNLTHVITHLAKVNRLPKTFKERFVREVGLDALPVKCFPDETEASIYADKVHFAAYWKMKGWEPKSPNWKRLAEALMKDASPKNKQHVSTMMMASKHMLHWDDGMTERFFAWSRECFSGPLRRRMLAQYLCIRLNRCEASGNREHCFEVLRQQLQDADNRMRDFVMIDESHDPKESWQEWIRGTQYAKKILKMDLDVSMPSEALVMSKSTEPYQNL